MARLLERLGMAALPEASLSTSGSRQSAMLARPMAEGCRPSGISSCTWVGARRYGVRVTHRQLLCFVVIWSYHQQRKPKHKAPTSWRQVQHVCMLLPPSCQYGMYSIQQMHGLFMRRK